MRLSSRTFTTVAALAVLASCGGGSKSTSKTTTPSPTPSPSPVTKKPGLVGVTGGAAPDPWDGRSDLIQAPPVAAPSPITLAPAQRFTLSNGLQVIAVNRPELPILGFDLAVRAGNLDEGRDKRVLADFVAELLKRGSKSKNAVKIADSIDFVGGHLAAAAGYENIDLACSVLTRDMEVCTSTLADIVSAPAFDKREIELVRAKLLAGLAQILDDPEALAGLHFANAVFGEGHPRGWPATARTISSISQKDLIAFHKAKFSPKNATLAVAGSFDLGKLKAALEKSFGKWKGGAVAQRELPEPPRQPGLKVRLIDNPALTQSTIVVGHPGIRHLDPDFYAVRVMNYILGGGGTSSRLMSVIRARGGKAYSATSGFESFESRGVFEASTSTRTTETVNTLKLMLAEITKLRDKGVTEAEVSDARANIAGNYGLSFQTASDVATALLSAELHKLDSKYVEELPVRIGAVTREEVNAAAKTRLDPEHLAIVIVGEGDAVEAQLKKAAIAYERIPFTDPISAGERAAEARLLTEAVPPEEAKKAKAILDAALLAKGGEDKLRAIKDISMTGKAAVMGAKLPGGRLAADVDRIMIPPDRMRIKLVLRAGKQSQELVQVVSGNKGMLAQGKQKMAMPPEMVRDLSASIWRDQDLVLMRHLEPGVKARVLGQISEKGRTFDIILLVAPDNRTSTTLYLDSKEHLLVRQTFDDEIEDYGDYKVVDGIKFAHLISQRQATEAMMVQIATIKVNSNPDPALFELK